MAYADQEIITAIKEGNDDRVLNRLYEYELPKVRKYILSNSGSEEAADDIFQDAVLVFYKQVKKDKFNPKYEIGAFIYSVARNLWINKAKRDKRSISLEEDYKADVADDANIVSDLISEEREMQVLDILGKLGERCKELLVYSIFNKYSMKEICEKMGFSSENAAKTRNYKCKQKLIALVKENPGIEQTLREGMQ